ncbi:FMN-binding glutamate synthase family protein [Effusibacillus pohliae]|uniref:FMN-binding glutamate synthase family protein n=1 Tax=Effusibacillus pohliae TaxID=232270 RepID=UPI0003603ACD|nr:FMN-binding glutamate synthase family protein [Effusibacillus pohliae]
MTNAGWFAFVIGSFIGGLFSLFFVGMMGIFFARTGIKYGLGLLLERIMKDRYAENIWEMVTAMHRIHPRIVVENSLRAESGKLIKRPFGTPRRFLHFDGLVFSPAQLAIFPAYENMPVDLQTVIGAKAQKPLQLEIPLLMAPMGYGVALSEKAKLAMAKAMAAVGSASNVGEGAFLPEERQYARRLILQYHPAHWSKSPEILRQADAIEIFIGRGATAGVGTTIPPELIQGKARRMMNIPPGEPLVIPNRHNDLSHPEDLRRMVRKLREITEGIPIGIKIGASHALEAELEIAIRAGVDFITVDGGQAGISEAAPILEDDFGLPTIYALSRSVQYLRKRGVKDRISLIISGGFSTPGHCLKALALGADAVYIGTIALWSMVHTQITKVVPWEPPTQLAFYSGSQTDQLNEQEAARNLENFFASWIEEMKIAMRALGKHSLRQINAHDLVALDEWTSHVTKVCLAYGCVQSADKAKTFY